MKPMQTTEDECLLGHMALTTVWDRNSAIRALARVCVAVSLSAFLSA